MAKDISSQSKVQVSIWEKQAWLAPADIVVAGAGLLGLWTAIELKKRKPEWRIVVAEAQAIPLGASSRNAGFACFGSAGELLADISKMGENAAMQVVLERYRGIQKINASCKAADIDLRWIGGYECLQQNNASAVKEALPMLNKLLQQTIGVEDVYQLATDAVGLFGLKGFKEVIANRAEGVLHSGYYLKMLERRAAAMEIEVLYGLRIDEVVALPSGMQINSSRGIFFAQQIVYTTNAYLSGQFPHLGIKPGRGQMVLLQPEKSIQWEGAFHASEGFYYWRNLNGNLLLGGGRHLFMKAEETMKVETSEAVINHLMAFANAHLLAGKARLLQQWAGIMAFTPNKQPMLKQTNDGVWAATCCNGMGVAISPTFAEQIAAKLTGIDIA